LRDDAGLKKATITAGANWTRLQLDLSRHSAEIEALLARNAFIMSTLGVQGTPSYLVGNYLVEGGLTRGQLRRLFRDARASYSK